MHLGLPAHSALDHDVQWLALLDELYALVENEGAGTTPAGTQHGWPEPLWPLVQRWAQRIDASSVQISRSAALQSPGCDAGLLSHRRITGDVIAARSASPAGFTATQAHEFHAFCVHLETASSLRSSLEATQASLSSLLGVIDALPTSLVVLDEHSEVVLLNRQGREWLAHTERAGLQARRLRLSAQHDVFERALHAFVLNPFAPQQPLHINGLDLQLMTLPGVHASVLLLVHERCDPARLREVAVPPATLARQMQRQYALTDKEVPLAWNLALGMPLKQYAGLSGRSVETARVQLKSVFRKLGTADQKGVGVIVFETLHAVALQSVGACLAGFVAERTVATPQPLVPLPWA